MLAIQLYLVNVRWLIYARVEPSACEGYMPQLQWLSSQKATQLAAHPAPKTRVRLG